jgi:hypothetical protein
MSEAVRYFFEGSKTRINYAPIYIYEFNFNLAQRWT